MKEPFRKAFTENRKGQTNQVFIWIFVLVLASLILLFGFKMVRDTSEFSDDVLVNNFFSNLNSKINKYYYLSLGSVGDEKFELPKDVECVCFVNGDVDNVGNCGKEKTKELINNVRAVQKDKEKDNVFLILDKSFTKTRDHIDNLGVGTNPSCIEVKNGLLEVTLENIGSYVDVKKTVVS